MHQVFKNILCAVSVSVVMMGAFSLSAHAQEETGTAGSSLGKRKWKNIRILRHTAVQELWKGGYIIKIMVSGGISTVTEAGRLPHGEGLMAAGIILTVKAIG